MTLGFQVLTEWRIVPFTVGRLKKNEVEWL